MIGVDKIEPKMLPFVIVKVPPVISSMLNKFLRAFCAKVAMEVLVIASDLRALGEVVKGRETGIIVPQKDPIKLAKEIMLLKEDKMLRNDLINNARKLILESFSDNKMIDSIEGLYNGLLENKKGNN